LGAGILELGIVLQVVIPVRHPQPLWPMITAYCSRILRIGTDARSHRARSGADAIEARDERGNVLLLVIASMAANSGLAQRLEPQSLELRLVHEARVQIGDFLAVGIAGGGGPGAASRP
jgi:hypothetical protein